eukprot:CAMPEP_0177700924 /NCGR_PEP_ID=MMETSP0484_2-20121128/6347_1 /TAXON_ID=354590 /ORGANISM="Rhodomonas lens, Strain RHODO" /LENGTH=108 /DNA_ID=CAMNT_0019212143 /DNA_START=469 /DNA_END=794 /DNA_ORIENTATION=-
MKSPPVPLTRRRLPFHPDNTLHNARQPLSSREHRYAVSCCPPGVDEVMYVVLGQEGPQVLELLHSQLLQEENVQRAQFPMAGHRISQLLSDRSAAVVPGITPTLCVPA